MSFTARHVPRGIRHLLRRPTSVHVASKRSFLSESFSCPAVWQQRLQTPTLQKVDVEDFALRIQEKFDREGSIAVVDMDIFANKLTLLPKIQMDFAQSVIYRFRHTNASVDVTDSTNYALIRSLLELKEYDRLREMLKDKIHYGIFLDHYSANLLLDHYIKNNMYLAAAEVAFDLMLQEDFSHPITRMMALYSCHKLWRDPSSLVEAPEEPVDEDDDEEKIIRVSFIENPWYDGHFDLEKISHLLGKSLMMITTQNSDVLERSYQLIGCGLFEQFAKGEELLRTWASTSDVQDVVSREALTDFMTRLENAETKDPPEPKPAGKMTMKDVLPFLTAEQKDGHLSRCLAHSKDLDGKIVEDFNLEEELMKKVKLAVSEHENNDVNVQEGLFQGWNDQREKLVEEQIQYYKEEAVKEEVEKKLEALREMEEKLTFFDNKYDIMLKARLGRKKQEIDDLFASEKLQNWAPRT